MIYIVGFSGRMRSGKTTAAEYIWHHLVAKEGRAAFMASFADQLKKVFVQLFVPAEWQWDIEDLNEHKDLTLPTINMTVRKGLQIFGTDKCRAMYSGVWTNALKTEINKSININSNAVVLIDDVRFPNEVEMCDITIRLTRGEKGEHETETALDEMERIGIIENWDYRVRPAPSYYLPLRRL